MNHVIDTIADLIRQDTDVAVDLAKQLIVFWGGLRKRDVSSILISLSSADKDIEQIIADVRTAFGV